MISGNVVGLACIDNASGGRKIDRKTVNVLILWKIIGKVLL